MARIRQAKHQDGAQTAYSVAMAAQGHSPSPRPAPCARLSSDGTVSEGAASEGAQTAMTSVADMDEDLDRDLGMADGDDTDYDYHDVETASTYPVSHYPRPASPQGTLMQLYLDGSSNAYSDM